MMRAALLACCLLAGCGRDAATQSAESAGASRAPFEHGRAVYNRNCYFCHGYSGDARTTAAAYLDPKPADFTAETAKRLSVERIALAVREGRPGTAMASFSSTLSARDIAAVSAFVHEQFVLRKAAGTGYHTAENGWPEQEKYRPAFAFATGEIARDVDATALSATQLAGRRLFLQACVTCHDGRSERKSAQVWEARALSYPSNADACAGCHAYAAARRALPQAVAYRTGPYPRHDVAPQVAAGSAQLRRGEVLFRRNCAFCHGADGSGRNWVGTFLEPHPRDLSDRRFRSRSSRARIAESIRRGVEGTSMPGWQAVLGPSDLDAVTDYVWVAFGETGR